MFGTYAYSQLIKGMLQIAAFVVIAFITGFVLGAIIF
jgi:hypothetical protein